MGPIYTSLLAYFAAASLLTVAPGLDTALVLRTATTDGGARAALAGLGIALGCFGWAVIVALELGALLAASALAYAILRWLGAAYLVWVGYKMLRYPRRGFVPESSDNQRRGTAFATGLLTNLLNPKVGVFYVTFLPQFVPPGVPAAPYMLLLGAIHGLLGLLWFGCLIAATRPLAKFMRRPAVVSTCDRLTGSMFVTFGVGLALQSRRS